MHDPHARPRETPPATQTKHHGDTDAAEQPTPDQAWFWTKQWQAGEAEASAQIAAENLPVYDDMATLLADIDIEHAPDAEATPAVQEITRLRTDLVRACLDYQDFAARCADPLAEACQLAAMASSYAYALAALLGQLARHAGAQLAEQCRALVDALINDDDPLCGANDDVMVAVLAAQAAHATARGRREERSALGGQAVTRIVHAMAGPGSHQPWCGAVGTVVLFAFSVTCPSCLALLERAGIAPDGGAC